MTWPVFADRDATQIDALIADRYLEALLAAGERRADDVPADPALDPELRAAARALRRAFVRVHPSFRFEEHLAARLAELAATQRAVDGSVPAGGLVPFPGVPAGVLVAPTAPAAMVARDPDLAAVLDGSLDPAHPLGGSASRPTLGTMSRPVILGGAVASAAISLAGVALVAWRVTRPARTSRHGSGPMARAARAAHGRRLVASLAGTGRTA